MRTLAIDPGKRQGWALFSHTTLILCGTGDPPCAGAVPYDMVIVEIPHCGFGRAAVSDLITLGMRAQKALDSVSCIQYKTIKPARWKGSVPKMVMSWRVREKLELREIMCLPENLRRGPLPRAVDVLDAIGIGLWAVGRGKERAWWLT
jgi:hypothetical protein